MTDCAVGGDGISGDFPGCGLLRPPQETTSMALADINAI
jgi:hypothetical protein